MPTRVCCCPSVFLPVPPGPSDTAFRSRISAPVREGRAEPCAPTALGGSPGSRSGGSAVCAAAARVTEEGPSPPEGLTLRAATSSCAEPPEPSQRFVRGQSREAAGRRGAGGGRRGAGLEPGAPALPKTAELGRARDPGALGVALRDPWAVPAAHPRAPGPGRGCPARRYRPVTYQLSWEGACPVPLRPGPATTTIKWIFTEHSYLISF